MTSSGHTICLARIALSLPQREQNTTHPFPPAAPSIPNTPRCPLPCLKYAKCHPRSHARSPHATCPPALAPGCIWRTPRGFFPPPPTIPSMSQHRRSRAAVAEGGPLQSVCVCKLTTADVPGRSDEGARPKEERDCLFQRGNACSISKLGYLAGCRAGASAGRERCKRAGEARGRSCVRGAAAPLRKLN